MTRVGPPDVSLYIPARNAARTLGAAIDSVRAQTVSPGEFFLLLDARSSDATARIAHDSGLRIVTQTRGRLGHGRNLALRACRTPWLACCDADVTLEPAWLESLLRAANDDVAAVGGATHETPLTPADRWRAVNMPHNWGPLPLDNPFMLVSEMLAQVAALRSVGGYRADLAAWEDSDLCQRLRQAGYRLRYEPAAVAWHARGDSVAGVLDLRWKYSFARQRLRLQHLSGLIDKLAINRVYCLQSLSQTLHSAQPDCCAISLLLWFHHARRDLQAVLGRWPLLEPAGRAECLALLDQTLAGCLGGAWRPMVAPLRSLLGPAAAPPARQGRRGLAATPGFARYLAAVRGATGALLETVPDELLPALVQSAERLAAPDRARPFEPPPLAVRQADRRRLAALPLRPAWTWTELRRTLAATLERDLAGARLLTRGPVLPPERAALQGRRTTWRAWRLAIVPHLEASLRPRRTLQAVLASADAAVIGYQPPEVFLAGVPVLSARDLAVLCAAGGFGLRDFHTEAGLTRLIAERGPGGEGSAAGGRRARRRADPVVPASAASRAGWQAASVPAVGRANGVRAAAGGCRRGVQRRAYPYPRLDVGGDVKARVRRAVDASRSAR